ncbi:hypothetical protein [Mycolicibacterium goodii]|uniref:hypothetical protein n=1 Tax=Mycolicibacterium goodii TaxID=134601 RepID=UPI001BDCB8C5|nr:hypothetical protein [Mycolicibacterium goodii]MBU8841576.1 hypothetical protein [Mycolicibacterium goodii]
MMEMETDRRNRLSQAHQTGTNIDAPWAAMNTVALILAAVVLRSHVDRHLPAPLLSPDQLARWRSSVNAMTGTWPSLEYSNER